MATTSMNCGWQREAVCDWRSYFFIGPLNSTTASSRCIPKSLLSDFFLQGKVLKILWFSLLVFWGDENTTG